MSNEKKPNLTKSPQKLNPKYKKDVTLTDKQTKILLIQKVIKANSAYTKKYGKVIGCEDFYKSMNGLGLNPKQLVRNMFGGFASLLKEAGIVSLSEKSDEQVTALFIKKIIEANEKYVKKFNKTITCKYYKNYISGSGLNYDRVSFIFGNFDVLKKKAGIEDIEKEETPSLDREDFDISENLFSKEKKTYCVTSAIIGEDIFEKALQSIKNYENHNKAKLKILLMKSLSSKKIWSDEEFSALENYLCTEIVFNSNLKAMDVMLSSQMTNPLTGLARFGQKEFSLIVASPKQQAISIPVGTNRLPHLAFSTGSISTPEYNKNRIGRISEQDHTIGMLIVETKGDIYHVRQVQIDPKTGVFFDLDKKYTPEGVYENKKAIAISLGDWHLGMTDPYAAKASFEQLDFFKPKYAFFHDLIDSQSVSHHIDHNLSARANRTTHMVFNSLETELNHAGNFLTEVSKKYQDTTFYIVASNHLDHITRYLTEGRWLEDSINTRLSLKLFEKVIDHIDPIKWYLEENFPSIKKNVVFLKRDDDIFVSPKKILMSVHGDFGPSGTRGSVVSMERSYGNSITGHSHSFSILRNSRVIGTNSLLDMGYNKGASSWTHTNAVVYSDGGVSMLTSINGKWKN